MTDRSTSPPVAAPLNTLSLPSGLPPLLTREKFAEQVGLPVGVVVGFINKGYLATFPLGRYSLVNIELLRKQCLDREFTL